MKTIELVFLVVGALMGVFLRYRVTQSSLILGTLPVNVLLVNIIGSFILGVFSSLSVTFNLDTKYSLFVAVGFCGSLTNVIICS